MKTDSQKLQDLEQALQALQKKYDALKKQKKFGLVFDPKEPERVVVECESKLPVLREVAERAIAAASGPPVNILIEGDNYHALSVFLLYFPYVFPK